MNETNTIGQRIQDARKQLNLTQNDLAQQLNITFQSVSKWESDSSLPDVELIPTIAQVLKLDISYLLTGVEATPNPSSEAKEEDETSNWGKIYTPVDKDLHGNTKDILSVVNGDIYGNVDGSIIGEVHSVHGNIEGNVIGTIHGDVDGYIDGKLVGTVEGRVKKGVHGKILGTVIGDGINLPKKKSKE